MKTYIFSGCSVATGHILGQSDACCACTIPWTPFDCYHTRVNRLSPTSCRPCEPFFDAKPHIVFKLCRGHRAFRPLSPPTQCAVYSEQLNYEQSVGAEEVSKTNLWTAFVRFVLFGHMHNGCNVFVRVLYWLSFAFRCGQPSCTEVV